MRDVALQRVNQDTEEDQELVRLFRHFQIDCILQENPTRQHQICTSCRVHNSTHNELFLSCVVFITYTTLIAHDTVYVETGKSN